MVNPHRMERQINYSNCSHFDFSSLLVKTADHTHHGSWTPSHIFNDSTISQTTRSRVVADVACTDHGLHIFCQRKVAGSQYFWFVSKPFACSQATLQWSCVGWDSTMFVCSISWLLHANKFERIIEGNLFQFLLRGLFFHFLLIWWKLQEETLSMFLFSLKIICLLLGGEEEKSLLP